MNHLGTQYMETERLVLRRFQLADAQAMYKNWASDDEVTRYLTWPAHSDSLVTEQVLKDWMTQYLERNFYQWAIVWKKESPEPIGSISVVRWDKNGKVPVIGYCMGRQWWGHGIMTEALDAVIGFLFDQVGVGSITMYHDVNNPRSGAVMRRCGMEYQGIREKADRNNQGVCDICCYSIEASDR